jgi:UDPglucose 6-dehydrogenase
MPPLSPPVAVIGLWHQGVVAAACLADWGYDVLASDPDRARIEKLAKGKAPLFEPGLDDLLAKGLTTGRLRFTDDPAQAVADRPIVLLMHDTAVNDNDESDLTEIFNAVKTFAPGLKSGAVLHVTAQVPVGTCDELLRLIESVNPTCAARVAYSPENLRLGQAIERFRRPPLPVLGSDDTTALEILKSFYAPCGVKWETTDLRTGEMTKHALNAFLAMSVCFANEIGNVCDEIGADGHRLAEILRLEPRVGPKALLFPGLGFSGGTLARDVQTLRRLGVASGLSMPLLDGAWASNQKQNGTVIRQLRKKLGDLKDRQIAVWGLTYKPETSTLRRSAALEVIGDLQREGARVTAHDPKADRSELQSHSGFRFFEDALKAASGADALVLMTPWSQYKTVDFSQLRSVMKGTLVFDTAGLWPATSLEPLGFEHLRIGRGRTGRNK